LRAVDVRDEAGAKPLHHAGQCAGALGCGEYVRVIAHQHVRVDGAAVQTRRMPKAGQVLQALLVREENLATIDPALDHVLGQAGRGVAAAHTRDDYGEWPRDPARNVLESAKNGSEPIFSSQFSQ
jgi:hypothetical protein